MDKKNMPVKATHEDKNTDSEAKNTQEQNQDLLSKLGIHVGDGEITINTNETKDFFKSIKTTLDTAVKNAEDSIKNHKETKEQSLKKAGIKVDNDVISIDTTKIQEFMQGVSKSAEGLITSLDSSIKDICSSHSKKS